VEVVASLVLLADRRAGRRSGWLPWAALTIGTTASLAANIATADTGTVSRVIAGWPAVALLIAVKLLAGILERRSEPISARAGDSAGLASLRAVPDLPVGPADRPSSRSRSSGSQAERPQPAARQVGQTLSGVVPHDVAVLEQAARAVRDELRRAGRPLTRDVLAARLRAAGYPVRNARLTPLMAALRAEPAATP